jgi:CRP-like cAMP-binding protein
VARGKESTNQLALVPLFSALSKSDLQQVDRAADRIEVEAGRELVTEGRTGREFFLILDGTAIVRRNGRKVATLGPGQFFGELSLLDKGPRTATVVAESDMKLLVLGQREFGGLIDGVPGMAAKLLQGLAHRLREADARTVS